MTAILIIAGIILTALAVAVFGIIGFALFITRDLDDEGQWL